MITSGINLVMAVVGFSLSIMFITFVCVRLICARIRMRSSRMYFGTPFGSDLATMERGYRGLEPRKLANFPTKKYRELCLSSNENAQCTICLSDYRDDDTLRFLPVCGHLFHMTCIDIWLHQHFTCPVCRISLRDLPEKNWFSPLIFSSSHRSLSQQGSTQPANTRCCHCMMGSNGCSSTTSQDSERSNAIQEGYSCSEHNGSREQARIKNATSREVASPSSQ